eukprot:3881090-Rhodomonas_salina.1
MPWSHGAIRQLARQHTVLPGRAALCSTRAKPASGPTSVMRLPASASTFSIFSESSGPAPASPDACAINSSRAPLRCLPARRHVTDNRGDIAAQR